MSHNVYKVGSNKHEIQSIMMLSTNLLSFPLATRNFQFFSRVLGGIGVAGSDRGMREEDEWPPWIAGCCEAKA